MYSCCIVMCFMDMWQFSAVHNGFGFVSTMDRRQVGFQQVDDCQSKRHIHDSQRECHRQNLDSRCLFRKREVWRLPQNGQEESTDDSLQQWNCHLQDSNAINLQLLHGTSEIPHGHTDMQDEDRKL